MTFLQLVNAVLVRLRESSVSTWNQTAYSTLIGYFVNESKRQVEDAWNWDALRTELSGSLTSGNSIYTITGSGIRFKNATVLDTSNFTELRNKPIQWIRNQQQLSSSITQGKPCYYAWNGNNGTDSIIEVYPTPDAAYNVTIHAYVPQPDLANNEDTLLVPHEPVIAGAYARALVERGEDGGLSSAEAYGLYKGILADQIAIEASRTDGSLDWVAV